MLSRGELRSYLEGYDRALSALGESSTEEDEEVQGAFVQREEAPEEEETEG